jgi:HlyD family secretion protein
VLIDIDTSADTLRQLGGGYRVEARIVTWQDADALKVPIGALFRRGDHWAVFVVRGGRARLASVDIGHRNTQEAEVVQGLNVGDELVLHPPDTLSDGMRIARRAS